VFLRRYVEESTPKDARRTAEGTAPAEQLTTLAVASRIRQSANQHLKPSTQTITDSRSASFQQCLPTKTSNLPFIFYDNL